MMNSTLKPGSQHSTPKELRAYQQRAVEMASSKSCIVVLPTGAGKTLIAATIAKKFKKTLFLVPTRLLVSQQAKVISKETGLHVQEFMSGNPIPTNNDSVIVSTPAAFISLANTNSQFSFANFGLIIFDEVHHVMKRHPYRTIARQLDSLMGGGGGGSRPQILGLTASLTYSLGALQISNAITDICSDLNLSGRCVFTCSESDLVADGYHASIPAELETGGEELLNDDDDDVKQSKSLEIPGKAHSTLKDFLEHVEHGTPPIHRLSLELMSTIRKIESEIMASDHSFESPIGMKGKRGNVGAWGAYANSKKGSTDSLALKQSFHVLEHLYEAVRVVINSRQCNLELAMQYLIFTGLISKHNGDPEFPALKNLAETYLNSKEEFSGKLEHLKKVLMSQWRRFGESLRCIVFVQNRLSTHILQHFVENDPELLHWLKSALIYATSTPATSTLSVTASQAKERVKSFATGRVNVLFATSVAEEGMDIPAANCVIRFDAIQTPVSLVQSRGRARQSNSSFIVMQEQEGRGVASLQEAEGVQAGIISRISSIGITSSAIDSVHEKKMAAQKSRRRNAAKIISGFLGGNDRSLMILNLYAQKTAAELDKKVSMLGVGFLAQVSIHEYGMNRLSAEGKGKSKKTAIQNAARLLIGIIKNDLRK